MTEIVDGGATTLPFRLTEEKLKKAPRVRCLIEAHGEEWFRENILKAYFSDKEIGQIESAQLKGWELKVQKTLTEAAQVYYAK